MSNKFDKRVELVGWLHNSTNGWNVDDIAACGARSCRNELSSAEILRDEALKNNREKGIERVFVESIGRGHRAVLDQSAFTFSADNVSRASTLLLCAPQYASHDQQSLRVATAQRGFYMPKSLDEKAEKIMSEQFGFYEKMLAANVPGEDARFILPLATKTAIQTTLGASELMHLDSISQREYVPYEVRDTVQQMVRLTTEKAPHLMKHRVVNYEILGWYPSSQLFAKESVTLDALIKERINYGVTLLDFSNISMNHETIRKAVEERDEAELANLKHYHFTFLAQMSLAAFHQATRQRTWDQSVQPLASAARNGIIVLPESVKEAGFKEKYFDLSIAAVSYVRENIKNPDAVMVLPHSLAVYDLMHINGWNAINAIGKRTCEKAQWEIRAIARTMAKKIKQVTPEIGAYAVPQGRTLGRCYEKESCGKCFRK